MILIELKNSKDHRVNDIFNQVQKEPFVPDLEAGIARVRQGGFALLMQSTPLRRLLSQDCRLSELPDLLMEESRFGVAVSKGSDLRLPVSRLLSRLEESREIARLKHASWPIVPCRQQSGT